MSSSTLLSTSPTTGAPIASPWTKDGSYIIESTRRAHACCRSCDSTIELGRLRVGVVYQHMNGFVCINWHHIECYPHVKEVPLHNLEGYGDLDPVQQQLVQRFQVQDGEARFLAAPPTCSA